jgi:hypothetical protein
MVGGGKVRAVVVVVVEGGCGCCCCCWVGVGGEDECGEEDAVEMDGVYSVTEGSDGGGDGACFMTVICFCFFVCVCVCVCCEKEVQGTRSPCE